MVRLLDRPVVLRPVAGLELRLVLDLLVNTGAKVGHHVAPIFLFGNGMGRELHQIIEKDVVRATAAEDVRRCRVDHHSGGEASRAELHASNVAHAAGLRGRHWHPARDPSAEAGHHPTS